MAVYFKLKALIEQKEIVDKRKITYRNIADEAGVSTNTLTQMANQNMKQVGLITIDKLCGYFGCQPGDLMVYIVES